ncbi:MULTISPECIES: hypothetical protein [Streptosporangium]|uniref:Uncharacterized protein n=1 Tax=Streptosporangium brasiliense TaxID=47480 RepID=A0ABT9R1Z0_9ACTN|nr:hypothetical protein [Streptosporangium brasiliense]MDP9862834.1 hypothetical protein [Streptosporangium brasiliense]
MPRRLLVLLLGLCVTAGCGATASGGSTPREAGPPPEASARAVEPAEAARAFELLDRLDRAWRERDCPAIEELTTWAENTLGGRACEATRNGRPAPARKRYTDAEFFLPATVGADRWFVALARRPVPAYFLFVHGGDDWRLAAGPIPVRGEPREPAGGAVPADDPGTGVEARLAPQRYLTYLTDPAGVSGVTFPKKDAARELFDELVQRPRKVRPDRLASDVRLLVGPERALLLPGGGALVIHALEIEHRQRAGPGRTSLRHPIYGEEVLRGFTGKGRAAGLTGTEIVLLVTEVSGGAKLSTVAARSSLADLTTG